MPIADTIQLDTPSPNKKRTSGTMSNSHQQSLNDDVVFYPVHEHNAEFLHCELERSALECLLSGGTEAFYNKISAEQLGPFLSPDEVTQLSSWVEDRISAENLENEDTESENNSDMESFSLQYFPMQSDMPAPSLDLGWPEKDRWEGMERVMVYTNPPVGQAPHIREVIRRLLQGATTLIALVADRVTDSAVIGDLNFAASRGVVVYIILNRRSAQENPTPHRLQHPNIRIRTVEGKSFFSRDGKMVVGELKENFILVDLLTVVLGSYSLTWTDAHLHRQLITVMSGPVVELFDREFRILYAASLPIPDSWNDTMPAEFPKVDGNNSLSQPELDVQKSLLKRTMSSPPPPITDSPVDWNALGVLPKSESFQDDDIPLPEFCEESPKSFSAELKRHTEVTGARREPSVEEVHTTECQDMSTAYHVAAEPRLAPDHQTMFGLTHKHERVQYSFLKEREERSPMFRNRDLRMDDMQEDMLFSHYYKQDCLPSMDRSLAENMKSDLTMPMKKPLILNLPHIGNSRDMSSILEKIHFGQNKMDLQQKMFRQPMSKSTLDLSTPVTETPPKSQANLYEGFSITPALALMKKRNDEVKSSFIRNVPALPRPRSFSFGLQMEKWKPRYFPEKNGEED